MNRFDKNGMALAIRMAKGDDRSLTGYSIAAGVSASYVSLLTRAIMDKPPSPAILLKLASASASDQVTYDKLMELAGFDKLGENGIIDNPDDISDWRIREIIYNVLDENRPNTYKRISKEHRELRNIGAHVVECVNKDAENTNIVCAIVSHDIDLATYMYALAYHVEKLDIDNIVIITSEEDVYDKLIDDKFRGEHFYIGECVAVLVDLISERVVDMR